MSHYMTEKELIKLEIEGEDFLNAVIELARHDPSTFHRVKPHLEKFAKEFEDLLTKERG